MFAAEHTDFQIYSFFEPFGQIGRQLFQNLGNVQINKLNAQVSRVDGSSTETRTILRQSVSFPAFAAKSEFLFDTYDSLLG
jgi:hypothetical protein